MIINNSNDNNSSLVITRKRNSSVELYRIIATFTVIITHFNGWFVGGVPSFQGFDSLTITQFGQMVIESATCICVNMFLLISGYFSLHLKFSSIVKLVSLLLCISFPFYIFSCVFYGTYSLKSLLGCFFVISRFGYFIQSYFMLLFFSPVINSFIEKYSKRAILIWTLFFLLIEFWFGCIMEKDSFGFQKGYSVIHFVFMYFVGRCIYSYKSTLLLQKYQFWGWGFCISTIIILMMHILNINFSHNYSNPIVVISSVCTFVPFLYFNYFNKTINWIASATLPVYVIQVVSPVNELLILIDNYLLSHYYYFIYLIMSAFVIVLYFSFCVLYGKACDLVINPLLRRINDVIGSKYDLL